jgi:hypothetical protein
MVFEVGDLIRFRDNDEIYEVVGRLESKAYGYQYDLFLFDDGSLLRSQIISGDWKKLTPQESAHVIAELICREGSQ